MEEKNMIKNAVLLKAVRKINVAYQELNSILSQHDVKIIGFNDFGEVSISVTRPEELIEVLEENPEQISRKRCAGKPARDFVTFKVGDCVVSGIEVIKETENES